jgi:exonuclease III
MTFTFPTNNSPTPAQEDKKLIRTFKLKCSKARESNSNLTIILVNINGLQLDQNPQRLPNIMKWMHKDNIDIMLLQEINTNMQHPSVIPKLRRILRDYQGTTIISSHTPYQTTTAYKPGGTAIILQSTVSKHIYARIIDPIGQWTGVTLQFQGNTIITIISTYQPPITESTKATTSFITQQKRWYIDRDKETIQTDSTLHYTDQKL